MLFEQQLKYASQTPRAPGWNSFLGSAALPAHSQGVTSGPLGWSRGPPLSYVEGGALSHFSMVCPWGLLFRVSLLLSLVQET